MPGNKDMDNKSPCQNCKLGLGEPFLCPTCQWHVMTSLRKLGEQIEVLQK